MKGYCGLLAEAAGQLIWPEKCNNCSANINFADAGLCKNCWQQIINLSTNNYCRKCGRDVSSFAIIDNSCPQCQAEKINFDAIARGGFYDSTLRSMILAFKNGNEELADKLAILVKAALEGSGFESQVDLYVPVPLHWSRRAKRGYSQANLLLNKIGINKRLISTDLVRIKRTRPQPEMDSNAKRAANVAGAFAVRYGHKFEDKNICLVDDIKTSGSTLNECSRVLKEAGTLRVYTVVAAVAGQNS